MTTAIEETQIEIEQLLERIGELKEITDSVNARHPSTRQIDT